MGRIKKEIRSAAAPAPAGPYSQGLLVGDRIYIAGQRPEAAGAGVPEGIEAQSRQVLLNMRAILEAGGASLADVAQVRVYLADLNDFTMFNAVYADFFTAPYPVRTTIGCALRNGILVEVDAVAELPGDHANGKTC